MRRIVVTEFVSLDGVMEDPGGAEGTPFGGWTFKFPDPEGMKYKLDEIQAHEAMLLGRVTYEGFAAAWPGRTDDVGFADRMNEMPKYVVSTRLGEASWNNTTVISGNVAEEVARLKAAPGNDILVVGSRTLAQFLMDADLIDEYPRLFLERSVDGLIAVDTPWSLMPSVPVVTVSGHNQVKGVTNVVLDHKRAAEVALRHLFQLGHRHIAFIKGQVFSSDTAIRWSNIEAAAHQLDLPISAKLVAQLEGDSPSPDIGYKAAKELLKSGKRFTALFAFNDISAIGAIHAFREAGLRVPEDVSVVGFDDIVSAAYQNPGLTTVRQPLREMGRIAAETVLRRIKRPGSDLHNAETTVEPELMIRETTIQVSRRANRN